LREKADRGEKEIKIWSAGCSTGQETYSLAILLHKIFKKNPELGKLSDWKIEIVGTDKNLYALRYAQRGEYSKSELMEGEKKMKAEGYSLDEYLEPIPHTDNFRIVEEIKKLVRFEYLDLDLLQRERMQNFDVIFCRNVYLHFVQREIILERLLKDMFFSLKRGGLLCCSVEDSIGAPILPEFYFSMGFAKLDDLGTIFEKLEEKAVEEEALEKQGEKVVRSGAKKKQQKVSFNRGRGLQKDGGEKVEEKEELPLPLFDLFREAGQIWDAATKRYRDGLWWDHRRKIKERIQEAIGLSHNKDKVLILGAGSNELYLRKLAEKFNEIILNNLDVDSLKRAKENLPKDLQNKVRLNIEDLSLVTVKLAREIENIVNTSSNIKEALKRTIDLIAKTEPQGRLSFSDEEFDLIISTMVISQFIPFIRSYIARTMNEKFGYGSYNNLIHDLDNSLSGLSERILKKHFEELFRILKPAGVICLSSDVEDLSGNSILPSDKIEKFLLPDMKIANKKEWVWKECPDSRRWVQSVIAKKESSPRVLILDIFGVLLQGPEEKEISGKIFGGIKQAFPEIDIKGILSQLQNGKNLESILSQEEIQQIQEVVKKNLFGAYKPSFEMGEMLKEAIQKGVKIYIFSEVGSLGFLGDFVKRILTETLNLFYPRTYFPRENLIISSELGYKKSQKEAWKKILKRIGVNPEEVVVIDDKLENIKAAEQAGISNSVRISDGGRDSKISKIRQKAEELTKGAKTEREKSDKLCEFARDIPYLLDPFWVRGPEEVLSQNEGMCVGKNWLLGEMHRELGFPVRYIVKEIIPEREFWNWIFWYYGNICPQDFTIKLPPIQSHIVLEVYLDGRWEEKDVTTDKFLKLGMELLGIESKREVVSQEVYNSLNEWVKNRQESIYIIENREQVIKKLNEGIEWIRNLGKCLYYFDRSSLPLASRELVVNPEKYFPGIELNKGIFEEKLSEEVRWLGMLKDAGIINPQIYEVLKEIEKRLFDKTIQRDVSDKEIEATCSEVIRAFLKNDDPLKELKDKVTEEVLGMLNKIEDKIFQQSDQLLAAVKVAIAANAIGFTQLMQANKKEKQERIDIESEINKVLNLSEEELKDFDYSVLRSHLSRKGQNILYLLDNAGEIVGDLPFIKRLLQDGHRITLVTRAKPVSNDITREDVNKLIEKNQIRKYFGDLLNRINVISSGSPMMGTDLRFATEEFISAWREADFIIAKGEGQWQTLYNQGLKRDVFFLIRVKNSQRIRGLDVQEGDYLLKYVPKITSNEKIRGKKFLSALLLLMVLPGKSCSIKGEGKFPSKPIIKSHLLTKKFWLGLNKSISRYPEPLKIEDVVKFILSFISVTTSFAILSSSLVFGLEIFALYFGLNEIRNWLTDKLPHFSSIKESAAKLSYLISKKDIHPGKHSRAMFTTGIGTPIFAAISFAVFYLLHPISGILWILLATVILGSVGGAYNGYMRGKQYPEPHIRREEYKKNYALTFLTCILIYYSNQIINLNFGVFHPFVLALTTSNSIAYLVFRRVLSEVWHGLIDLKGGFKKCEIAKGFEIVVPPKIRIYEPKKESIFNIKEKGGCYDEWRKEREEKESELVEKISIDELLLKIKRDIDKILPQSLDIKEGLKEFAEDVLRGFKSFSLREEAILNELVKEGSYTATMEEAHRILGGQYEPWIEEYTPRERLALAWFITNPAKGWEEIFKDRQFALQDVKVVILDKEIAELAGFSEERIKDGVFGDADTGCIIIINKEWDKLELLLKLEKARAKLEIFTRVAQRLKGKNFGENFVTFHNQWAGYKEDTWHRQIRPVLEGKEQALIFEYMEELFRAIKKEEMRKSVSKRKLPKEELKNLIKLLEEFKQYYAFPEKLP
ncbi:MAG TPA: DUF89 family protein, partial [Candidatus Altiarchaeales archaeon]|nr:DUF89 family protein [Candidatus Altiarchaeales archaeon]